jgi:hypothetical protein
LNMKPEHHEPTRKGKPRRKNKISTMKRRMLTVASQEINPITFPKLREIYSTKIEWVRLGKGASSQTDKISKRAERKRSS